MRPKGRIFKRLEDGVHLTVSAGRELGFTVRSGLNPLARLFPLPEPNPVEGRHPVVLVHGFMGNQEILRPLARTLLNHGCPKVTRITYSSINITLETIIGLIDRAVSEHDGPVDLVGHSLGAFASRAYLKTTSNHQVRRFIAIGAPFGGTSLYRFVPSSIKPALDPRGAWVERLNALPEFPNTWVVRARYDHQVFPPHRASLNCDHETVIPNYGHNGLLWAPQTHQKVVEILSSDAE